MLLNLFKNRILYCTLKELAGHLIQAAFVGQRAPSPIRLLRHSIDGDNKTSIKHKTSTIQHIQDERQKDGHHCLLWRYIRLKSAINFPRLSHVLPPPISHGEPCWTLELTTNRNNSKGTAANSLVDVFNRIIEKKNCRLNYIIPISDNGGSSSELIRFIGGPSE